MALSNLAKGQNYQELLTIIHSQYLQGVKNKQDMLNAVHSFFDENDIDMGYFSGFRHKKIIMAGMQAMLERGRFNLEKAKGILPQIVQKLYQLDEEEKLLYTNQAEEVTIIKQLQTKGYVDSDHLLTDPDINRMFEHNLKNKLLYTYPVDFMQNAPLKEAISANKNKAGKLLIPVNLGRNHWVLVIRNQSQDRVTFTCWDPLPAPAKPSRDAAEVKRVISQFAAEVYDQEDDLDVEVNYEYAGEQYDGVTCGYRVTQKAFKEAGIDNDFTKAPAHNPARLCFEFVKEIAKTDQQVSAQKLQYFAEGNAPLVYAKKQHPKQAEINTVVKHKKEFQEGTDAYLAIALQDVYCRYRDIDSDSAFRRAKENLQKTDVAGLLKTKEQVVNWLEKYHTSKQPKLTKNVKPDRIELDDFSEKKPTERSPLITVK